MLVYMTHRVSATIPDDYQKFLDENPKYSVSGLLQQAIAAEMDSSESADASHEHGEQSNTN